MDNNEIFYTDRQVFESIAGTLKEIDKTLKVIAEKGE